MKQTTVEANPAPRPAPEAAPAPAPDPHDPHGLGGINLVDRGYLTQRRPRDPAVWKAVSSHAWSRILERIGPPEDRIEAAIISETTARYVRAQPTLADPAADYPRLVAAADWLRS